MGRIQQRDIEFICNLFVHSYVFVVSGHSPLEGVFVSTDRQKNKRVYFVSLKNIVKIFRIVGRDYPRESTFIRQTNGDLIAKVGK